MKEKFEALLEKLESAISANDSEKNTLKKVSKNILLVEEAIVEFHFIAYEDSGFRTVKATQINCNKVYIPQLYAKLLFQKKLYKFENQKLHATLPKFKEFCERELEEIRVFFVTHATFCQRYQGGYTENDKMLFTNIDEDDWKAENSDELLLVSTNPNSILIASLLAYDQYAPLLKMQLPGASSPVELSGKGDTVTYRGSKIALIEIGMGLFLTNDILVNGKPATETYIRRCIERFFGVDLKNWGIEVSRMKTRKDPLPKLTSIMNLLLAYIGQDIKDRPSRRRS
jgi:hypothetical protein